MESKSSFALFRFPVEKCGFFRMYQDKIKIGCAKSFLPPTSTEKQFSYFHCYCYVQTSQLLNEGLRRNGFYQEELLVGETLGRLYWFFEGLVAAKFSFDCKELELRFKYTLKILYQSLLNWRMLQYKNMNNNCIYKDNPSTCIMNSDTVDS